MIENLEVRYEETKNEVAKIQNLNHLETEKAKFFGNNGLCKQLMQTLSSLPKEEKPAAGQAINRFKQSIETLFRERREQLEEQQRLQSLGRPIDPTLPTTADHAVYLHPLTLIQDKIVQIFSKLGFVVANGTEVETEWFCFDALNTPESHPSRDDKDSFYLPQDTILENVTRKDHEQYVLRSHTSSVQIHTMLQQTPPIKILSPGRVFRKDAIDATHAPNFHQCEGLYIDKQVSAADLKATLDFLFTELLGEQCESRMRPSFFPFVSPGFEVDFRVKNLGKLSNKWIEMGGCGMVAPSVLRHCNLDPEVYSGFAFGVGIERLAMLLYGIDDIRHFTTNDTRFLKQFPVAFHC